MYISVLVRRLGASVSASARCLSTRACRDRLLATTLTTTSTTTTTQSVSVSSWCWTSSTARATATCSTTTSTSSSSSSIHNMELRRYYSQHRERAATGPGDQRGRAGTPERRDSDSDSDSDTEHEGRDKSMFWRRKMRTVHNILDVDKDGLVSYDDFLLFGERFKSLGHLDESHARDFIELVKVTWEQQWGAVDRYNLVTVDRYLEDMLHVLEDEHLRRKAHAWLPYLFKAVDADNSGYISVKEFKLFYKCLGVSEEHAAVAFASIDTNSDGKLSQKEFVKLGEEFFTTLDETRVSKMFWGPLVE